MNMSFAINYPYTPIHVILATNISKKSLAELVITPNACSLEQGDAKHKYKYTIEQSTRSRGAGQHTRIRCVDSQKSESGSAVGPRPREADDKIEFLNRDEYTKRA